MAGSMMAPRFPSDWCGTWKGLGYVNVPGDNQSAFRMVLDIKPLARPDGTAPPSSGESLATPRGGDRYTWTITMTDPRGAEADRTFNHEIVVVDANRGLFEIDEGQGVRVPLYDMMGPLYAVIDRSGHRETHRYMIDNLSRLSTIQYEVLSVPAGPGVALVSAQGEAGRAHVPETDRAITLVRRAEAILPHAEPK